MATKPKISATKLPVPEPEDVQNAPARSEVMPGGGTRVGAILHVAVPVRPTNGATLAPTSSPATEGTLQTLTGINEGEDLDTLEATSWPLVDGGYANAQRVRVVHQMEPGHVVVEVVL